MIMQSKKMIAFHVVVGVTVGDEVVSACGVDGGREP
jgi:hypothetical protein